MTDTQFKIEHCPHGNAHRYHSLAELTSCCIIHWERGSWLNPEERSGLTDLLAVIPGVVGFFLKAYELTVVKAELFDWEPIDQAVKAAMEIVSGELPV